MLKRLHVFALLALVAHAAAMGLERVVGGAWVLRAVSGFALIHGLPGLYVAGLLLGRRPVTWGVLALAGVGVNFAAVIVLTTLIKLAGQPVSPLSLWLAIAATTAGAGIVAQRTGRFPQVERSRSRLGWLLGAGCAGIAAYVLLAQRPIPMDEDHFLTPDFQWRLARLDDGDEPARRDLRVSLDPGRQVGPAVWTVGPGRAVYRVSAPGPRVRVRWLLHASQECRVAVELPSTPGQRLSDHYFHPPFSITRHPHNYPPASDLAAFDLPLTAGAGQVHVSVRSSRPDCVVTLHDLTGKSKREAVAYVRGRFAIWDIGDVREQLSLARNLRTHVLPFSYSYGGTTFGRGGYTLTHLPLRSYVGMAALVLMGDSMSSFLVVWVGQLGIIFLLTVGVALPRGSRCPGVVVLGAALSVLVYATLVRANVEGACLRTTSVVVVLGAAYWLLSPSDPRQNGWPRWLPCLFAALCLLTKVGLMALPALLAAHGLLRASGRGRVRTALALSGGALAAAGIAVYVMGQALGVWDVWWATLMGGSFLGKFSIAVTALTDAPPSQDFVRLGQGPLRSFAGAFADVTWWVLLGSCAFPLAALCRRDRPALVLLAAGLFGYGVVALSDPSLIIPNVYCSHYFTRVAGVVNLLAAGGLRCIGLGRRGAGTAWWLALALTAIPLAAHEHHRQDAALERYPWHRAMYRAAVIDYLKHRAADHLRQGRILEARDECYKMRLVDESYLPTAVLWANCDQAEGKWASAAKHYEIALRRPGELDDAFELIASALNAAFCYAKLGNVERGRHWLAQATGTEGFAACGLAAQADQIRRAIDAAATRAPGDKP